MSGSAKEIIDAGIRLVEIGRELTDVAMKSLRAMTITEKQRYDAQYDALQVERTALKQKYGLED